MTTDEQRYLSGLVVGAAKHFMNTRYRAMEPTQDALELAKSDIVGLLNYLRGIGAIKGSTYTIDNEQVLMIHVHAYDFTSMSWACQYDTTVTGLVFPEVKRTV